MRFRCPSCGFRGIVRVPEYFPRGKDAPVRCSRCHNRFSLTIGRLWPQVTEEAYGSLAMDAPSCRGERVGRLWAEVRGTRTAQPPLLILPGHPAFPHELMHDPLDPLGDYTRLVFLELLGYADGTPPAGAGGPALSALLKDLEALRRRLATPVFDLLAHLYSAPMALQLAGRLGPQACRSLTLVCPDLGPVPGAEPARSSAMPAGRGSPNVEARLVSLVREEGAELMVGTHMRGLVSILAPRTSPTLLARGFAGGTSRSPGYRPLSRLRIPTLVLTARDGTDRRKEDALFLKNALPSVTLEELDPGGIWAPWLPGERFRTHLSRFLFRGGGPKAARSSSACATPAAWIGLAAVLLGWALAIALSRLAFLPAYVGAVLPLLVGTLLPLLGLLAPRGIPPGFLFRLNRWHGAGALLGLLAGLLFGAGTALLLRLLTGDGLLARRLPPLPEGFLPPVLASLPPGAPGRAWLAVSLLPAALLSIAAPGNLLALRRAAGRVILPALLFALLPPLWPDILWKLPVGLAGAFLFSRSLSFYPLLLLIAGFETAAGILARLLSGALPPDLARILLERSTGPAAAVLLIGLGLLCLMGSPRHPLAPARMYPTGRKDGYRWHPGWGTVTIILSTLGAAVLVVGFLQVAP